MSNEKQLKRYDIDSCKIVEHKYGQYVFYPDYQSLQSERDEYRQRLEENVNSIESMLHHNEVLTKERDRLREAGNNLANISKEYNEALSKIFEKDSPAIVRINMFINQWNTLTKKEVSDGE